MPEVLAAQKEKKTRSGACLRRVLWLFLVISSHLSLHVGTKYRKEWDPDDQQSTGKWKMEGGRGYFKSYKAFAYLSLT